ncbi:hypothetical protein FACS189434_03580 [Bacteroidia bacterium]|nr:hypothetical protein FACS189434_03580 [Bacteroidia bacterium]
MELDIVGRRFFVKKNIILLAIFLCCIIVTCLLPNDFFLIDLFIAVLTFFFLLLPPMLDYNRGIEGKVIFANEDITIIQNDTQEIIPINEIKRITMEYDGFEGERYIRQFGRSFGVWARNGHTDFYLEEKTGKHQKHTLLCKSIRTDRDIKKYFEFLETTNIDFMLTKRGQILYSSN